MESAIKDLTQRLEIMERSWNAEKAHLETLLEKKNQEVKRLESLVETMKNEKEEVANLKKHMDSMENRMRTQVANLEKQVIDRNLERSDSEEKMKHQDGLMDLPYLMVCAFQNDLRSPNSVVPYDRITTEYNNADQPGGKDRMMYISIIPMLMLVTMMHGVALTNI